MRHRAPRADARLHALAVGGVLALGMICAGWCAGGDVAPVGPSAANPVAVVTVRPRAGAGSRHETLAARVVAPGKTARESGSHEVPVAVLAAAAVGVLLAFGGYVVHRRGARLPRFVVPPIRARAPPALV